MKRRTVFYKHFFLRIGAAILALSAVACAQPAKPASSRGGETPGLANRSHSMERLLRLAEAPAEGRAFYPAQRAGLPRHVADTISALDGRLTLTLDAEVTSPDVPTIPIVRVSRSRHTREGLDALFEGIQGRLTFDEYSSPASMIFTAYVPPWASRCYARIVTGDEALTAAERAKLTILPSEAKAMAEAFLAERGLPMAVQYVSILEGIKTEGAPPEYPDVLGNTYYVIGCTRRLHGLGCSTPLGGTGENEDAPGYWPYERILLGVHAGGVGCMSWAYPLQEESLLLPDAAILPFDDILDVFSQMIIAVNEADARNGDYCNGMDINVQRIALEYQRIEDEAAADGSGVLVPAWCFYGSMRVDELHSSPDTVADWQLDTPLSLAVINAIDGSFIDAERAYRHGHIR